MKKTIVILFIFLTFTTFAQQLVEENKTWSIAEFSTDSYPIEELSSCFVIKTGRDTIINNKTFLSLLISYDSMQSNLVSYGKFLRQENNIVYCYNSEISEEYILYDFNLSENDSFKIKGIELFIKLDSIRSINDFKHYFFSNNNKHTIWVEGIGCLDGLIKNSGNIFYSLGGYSKLLCCESADGVLIYQNPYYPDCKVTSSAEFNSANKKLIELFPSPAGLLRLSLLNGSKGELSLYSPEGKQLLKSNIAEREMEICSPAEGLMLFRFVNEKGEEQTGKVFAIP